MSIYFDIPFVIHIHNIKSVVISGIVNVYEWINVSLTIEHNTCKTILFILVFTLHSSYNSEQERTFHFENKKKRKGHKR